MTRQPWIRLAVLLGCGAVVAMATPMIAPLSARIPEHIVTCALWIAFAVVSLLVVLPDSREDEHGEPVCTRCLNVVPQFQHYCTRCGTAVGRLTPCMPFENIPYYCEFFGRLWNAVWIQPGVSLLRRAGYLAVIVWLAPWLFLGLPWVPRAQRLAHRRRNGLCLKCGYNLAGNVSGACPECGESVRE